MSAPTPLFPSFVTHALERFNQMVDEREEQERQRQAEDDAIRLDKSEKLMPVRMLLKSLMDLDLTVRNSAYANPDAPLQPLRMVEEPSSGSYAPGVSLRLDHPAVLEIAIPNAPDVARLGVVVINCAQKHPHGHLFETRFKTVEAACEALAEFIALNTVARKRKPHALT